MRRTERKIPLRPNAEAAQRAAQRRAAPISITFEVYPEHAPALRSLIEEKSNAVGAKLEGPAAFAQEKAWTAAAIAVAALRAAIAAKVPHDDPNY